MSETEHRKGTLKPTGKTLKQYAPLADDILDLNESAVEVDGLIYEVEEVKIEPYDDIFESSKNEDGSINFEVKYYNGGCGFNEAIDLALNKE